jgi:hypothetical protein
MIILTTRCHRVLRHYSNQNPAIYERFFSCKFRI